MKYSSNSCPTFKTESHTHTKVILQIKPQLKIELEAFGRMFWFLQNDEKEFNLDKFKPKSMLNPRNENDAISIYISSLEEKLMSTEILNGK